MRLLRAFAFLKLQEQQRRAVVPAGRASTGKAALACRVAVIATIGLLAAPLSASAETYAHAVQTTTGITHFWPMEESSGSSFADLVGGADASISGGVTLGQPGGLAEESQTALFNGSSGAAEAALNLTATHKLTVEFWMKWSAFADNDSLAMEFTPNFNESPGGFLIDPNSSGGNFGVGVGEGETRNNAYFERPSAAAWHHYAFVIDTEASGANEITPYIDGHAVSYSKTESHNGGSFANSTLYWMSRDASSLFGGGAMQDLAIYDHALSSSEVLEHFAVGAGGPKASFSSSPVSASAGVPVHLNASGSSSPGGSITDYAWDFDGEKGYGSDSAGSPTTSHTFSTPGTYTVDLRVKDGLGQSASTSKTIVVGPAPGAYAHAVQTTTGITHFWPMEESSGSSFADLVGGADASISGGVTLGQPGGLAEESQTALFNGSSGAAEAALNLTATHKLTVEFWMKWSAFADNDSLAMEFTPNFNESPGGFLIDPNSSGGNFGVGVGEGETRNNAYFERPSAAAWHHYAFVIDTEASGANEITPYIDGHAVSYSKTESHNGGSFANSTLYWMSRDASSLFGGGAMQDLAIYDHALSSSEVLEHFAVGAGGPKASFSSSPVSASAGVPVHLNASGSSSPGGSITDYAWDFDGEKGYGSDSAGSPTTSHTFSTPGTYTVDLRVKDGLGQSASTSKTIVVGPAPGAYAHAVQTTTGITHFWPMEESSGSSFADLVGGADASISGGVTLGQPGGLAEESQTALFNGSSGAAEAALNLTATHKLTVEFWMKWSAFADNDSLAMEFTPNFNESPGGFLIDPNSSGGNFGVGVGEGETRNNAYFERPSAAAWHHYAFVIDTEASGANEITPYIDGHAVSYSKTESHNGGSFANSTLYWMSRDASSLFGGGAMQDLAIYDHALSSSEVLEHFAVGAGGPENTAPPTISGTTEDGQTLSASAGSWTGAPSYAYQWQRCDAFGETCSGIEGATSSTYEAGFVDVGHRLRVLVTATNAGGSAEASSSAGAFIAPTPPTELGFASEFGTGGSGDGQFKGPWGVAIGAGEVLFVLDRENDRVEKFNEAGEYLGQFGAAGSGDGQLRSPVALAVDGKGHVWVTDGGNERLEEFDENGEFIRTAGEGLVGNAEGIAFDHAGRVWVSATYLGHLAVFGEDGEHLKDVGSHGSEPGQLGEPEGIAVDGDGHVWVADFANERVATFDEAGEYLSQFGTSGAAAGRLSGPFGIAIDAGHIFLGQFGFNRLQEFNKEGDFIAQLGVPGEAAGQLGFPTGLAVSPAHSLLVADGANSNVKQFSPEAAGAPASLAPPSLSGNPGVGAVYEAGAGIWSGSPRRSYAFQWQRCDEHGEGCADISGETSPSYTVAEGDLGSTVRMLVTATNSLGSASRASVPSEVIVEPPVNTTLPMIVGTPQEGVELTMDPGEWERAESYGYEWQRCDALGEECVDVERNWEKTYTPTEEDGGHTLRVIVTASNGAGEARASSLASEVVQLSYAPANDELPSIDGVPYTGKTLTASPGSWHPSAGASYAYQWERCDEHGEECAPIEGATSSTYPLAEIDNEHTIRVAVTATNSLGDSSATSETTSVVTIASSPSNTGLPTISGFAETGQTLSATPGSWESIDSPSYTYEWKRCDEHGEECAAIEGATSSTYLVAEADVGHKIRVAVTATNSIGDAAATSGATALVTPPVPPSNSKAPTVTGLAKVGRTLSASAGTWSTPHTPLSYTYQWKRCNGAGESCSNIAEATGATYTLGSEDTPGHTLRVTVTATDSRGASASSNSNARAILSAVRVTEYAYDANGNLESSTNGNGHATTYEYGPGNEQTKVTQADRSSAETGYDGDGLVTSETDGNGHTTEYKRNVLGEVTEATDPLGRKTKKEYDEAGNLTSITDPAGRTTTLKYDPANRLIEKTYSDGTTPDVEYEYDDDGNKLKMVDGTGTSTYHYDELDRLTETTNGHSDSASYEYDLAGNQTNVTYPSGESVERAFDADGRLESVKDWLGNDTNFAYDPDSNLTSTTFPAGTGETDRYAYNLADEMGEAKFAKGEEMLASLSYARDNAGQLASATSSSLPKEGSTAYSYNPGERLSKDGTIAYEYDDAGNPTKLGTSTAAYDEASQLEHVATTNYSFDEVGERTKATPSSGPATSYGYDQAGDLTSVEREGEGETPTIDDSYAYDGDGLRTSQTKGATTEHLTWDGTEGLPLILSEGGYSFIYGPSDTPIEQIDAEGHVTYLHHDQQNSIRMLSGEDGSVEGKRTYDAYGNLLEHTGSGTSPLGYDGQYTDADTGLVYLRAREYDPKTGEFLSVDPLVSVTRTPYAYAGGDPLNRMDPSGLLSLGDIVGGIGEGLEAVGNGLIDAGEAVASAGKYVAPVVDIVAGAACVVFSDGVCAYAIAGNFIFQQSLLVDQAAFDPSYDWAANEAAILTGTGLGLSGLGAVANSGLGALGRAGLGAAVSSPGWLLDAMGALSPEPAGASLLTCQ